VSRFHGQKIIVFNKWGDSEGLNYAGGFISALSAAGWDFSKCQGAFARPQMFESNFRNARVFVSLSDYNARTIPAAGTALTLELMKLNIVEDSVMGTDDQLAAGELALRISGQLDASHPTTQPSTESTSKPQ